MDRLTSSILWHILPLSLARQLLSSDIVQRYRPVITKVHEMQTRPRCASFKVLDVGGGPGGIALFLDGTDAARVVICDLKWESLKRAKATTAAAVVVGDAMHLPFSSESLPVVVMVHALEHIPGKAAKTASIFEMVRVSRDAMVLEGPFGKHAARLSRLFTETLRRIGRPENPVALEHLTCGIPDIEETVSILPGRLQVAERRNL